MDRDKIVELLHDHHFRLTRERERLLEIFAESACMLTPSQLFDRCQAQQVKVGLTTVYRLLEALTKVGVATPFLLDGSIFYAFCDGHHHHHFVCLSCHSIRDLHECPTFARVPDDYEVYSHRADLFGICPNCQPETQLAHGRNHP